MKKSGMGSSQLPLPIAPGHPIVLSAHCIFSHSPTQFLLRYLLTI
jgi:hypothetical protein